MVSFFGIIHQSGGCGPELMGAIDVLTRMGVPVRCILPEGDPITGGDRADYLRGRGVAVVNYRPGMFASCPVLVSFGEEKCLEYIRTYSDRPEYMMWSGCMAEPTLADIHAVEEGLVDEYVFQTERNAKRVGEDISTRTGKRLKYRKGYVPFISSTGLYSPQPAIKSSDNFTVLRATRDDADKWHEDSWRMFVGVSSPPEQPVKIEVVGWGQEARSKVGDPTDPTSRWAGQLNLSLHPHVYDAAEMNAHYERAHVLLHYYPFVENHPFAVLQAMLAGAVVVGANEGGFLDFIRDRETGFLARSTDEAAFFTSGLAFDSFQRARVARAAREWLLEEGPGNFDRAAPWWKEIVEAKNAGGGI